MNYKEQLSIPREIYLGILYFLITKLEAIAYDNT